MFFVEHSAKVKFFTPLAKDGEVCYTIDAVGAELVRMHAGCLEHPHELVVLQHAQAPAFFLFLIRKLQNLNYVRYRYFIFTTIHCFRLESLLIFLTAFL